MHFADFAYLHFVEALKPKKEGIEGVSGVSGSGGSGAGSDSPDNEGEGSDEELTPEEALGGGREEREEAEVSVSGSAESGAPSPVSGSDSQSAAVESGPSATPPAAEAAEAEALRAEQGQQGLASEADVESEASEAFRKPTEGSCDSADSSGPCSEQGRAADVSAAPSAEPMEAEAEAQEARPEALAATGASPQVRAVTVICSLQRFGSFQRLPRALAERCQQEMRALTKAREPLNPVCPVLSCAGVQTDRETETRIFGDLWNPEAPEAPDPETADVDRGALALTEPLEMESLTA